MDVLRIGTPAGEVHFSVGWDFVFQCSLCEGVFISGCLINNTMRTIYIFLAELGLPRCTQAFSSCGAWVSHCGHFSFAEHRLRSCGTRA